MLCSTPVIEPCIPCKHPLEYLFENAYLATLGLENKVSFLETLITILNQGLYVPNCNICCSDCGIYVLASVETYLIYAEAVGELNPDCCLNLFASIETEAKYTEAASSSINNCCNIEFQDCFNKLYCWLNKPEGSVTNLDILLDKGLVEYGAFYDKCNNKSISGLCYISEFLKKNCDLNIGGYRYEFIELLLDSGIVISCEEDRVVITSIETYFQYLEAVSS